jgi:metallophosphoesterase (TIGR03767 family)
MHSFDTRDNRIVHGDMDNKGWRNLQIGEGEILEGEAPSPTAVSILSLIHISDLHICDAQSPARLEVLDRLADPHNPMSSVVKLVGTYRPNEALTAQTLEAMVQTINQINHGPASNREIDAVVITGDVTDNAQANELDWYLTLLDGGEITPDSGDFSRWEGVGSADPSDYDRSYWTPDGAPQGVEADYPRELYGFPLVEGLFDAVRKGFVATGLRHKWFATHGNHDALIQGTLPGDEYVRKHALSGDKAIELSPDTDLSKLFENFNQVGPANYLDPHGVKFRSITPDERRNINNLDSWAAIHQICGHDHGLTEDNVKNKTKYWTKDINGVRLISLDTVNHHGGWQGSIDKEQFQWLKNELSDTTPQYFVILSHHPASTLFNLYAPEGESERIGEIEVVELLSQEKRVVLWLAGHNHQHKIERIGNSEHTFWHIQTASNIDWPQQGRMVELLKDGEKIVIATSVFDHQSPVSLDDATSNLNSPVNIAGLSRLLAANDWQRRTGDFAVETLAGEKSDRNRFLWL